MSLRVLGSLNRGIRGIKDVRGIRGIKVIRGIRVIGY
jgi:hypothetical protein